MTSEQANPPKPVRTYSKNHNLVEERRQHIMDCGLALFLKHGYHGTSIRQISEATGLTAGALYRYIGSKEDILHLLAHRRAVSTRELRQQCQELQGTSSTRLLAACIRRYIYLSDRDRDIILFFNREVSNMTSDDRRGVLGSALSVSRFFEQILLQGIEDGKFRTDHPFSLAHDIFMLGQTWALRRWLLGRYFTMEEYTEIHLDGILRQLGVPPEQYPRLQTAQSSGTGAGTGSSVAPGHNRVSTEKQ